MLEPQLPVRYEWLVRERDHGKLALEPFDPRFALTVGNAYRRVLLSSIHGSAPTWVKIENVLHEFSYLPGVTEDTLDIMLNLREVVFSLHLDRPKILWLKAQGVGTVKASDFEPDADVEILTPDQPLATLDKARHPRDGGLRGARARVRTGREARARGPAVNALLLDANFSPIKRVNFTVETLPGKDKEERLLLEVWTKREREPRAGGGGGVADPRGPLQPPRERSRRPADGGGRGRAGRATAARRDQRNPVPQRRRTRAVGAGVELPEDGRTSGRSPISCRRPRRSS